MQQQYQNETHQGASDRAVCELLRVVARPSATDDQICALANNIRNWDALLLVSKEHRVVPLLFTRLMQSNASLPPEILERLESEYQHNVFHCMANAAELIAILDILNQHAISAMPFKGIVLAASVYGDLNARTAGDLDLLIGPRDRKRATELLLDRGYRLITSVHADLSPIHPDCYEYHFERPRDGMVTELRWMLELITPRYRPNLGMNWVWSRRQSVVLAGAKVPDIDPATTLLMLCMHGAKHVWTRLVWILDVAQLLIAHPEIDWKEIEREAQRTGLDQALALGVLLAHRIAGAPVPKTILRRFESVGAVRKLVQHIDAGLFDAPGSALPGFLPYSILLLGLRDRLRTFLRVDFFQPNLRDYSFVKLPRSLRALYYLVRPLRLLLDRSPR